MREKEQGIYEFHNFQLDVGKGVLFREDEPVTLQWKTFELLCTLVKSNGNLITRDELMSALWADTFVEDNNLSQHIRALRKALGENGGGAKFIETVPGRGYRFLPVVRIVSTTGENGTTFAGAEPERASAAEYSLEKPAFKLSRLIQPTAVSSVSGSRSAAKAPAFHPPDASAAVVSEASNGRSAITPESGDPPRTTRRRRGLRRGLKSVLWALGIGFGVLVLFQIFQILGVWIFTSQDYPPPYVKDMIGKLLDTLAIPVVLGWSFAVWLFFFGVTRIIYALFEKEDAKLTASRFEKSSAVIIALVIAAIFIPNLIASYRNSKEYRQSQIRKTNQNQIRSIAVLPLKTLSSNAGDEELRIRITDALITRLGGLKDIAVRPTDSVLRQSGSEQSIVEIGKKLKVDAILDGRIQSEGENLRVTLQLISVAGGEQIWSEQFDGQAGQILNLQDRISARLLKSLNQDRQQQLEITARPTENAEAYEAYLKARYLGRQMKDSEHLYKAIDYYRQAIEFDPRFADGYGGLAGAQFRLYSGGFDTSPENIVRARENLQKALAINPDSVEASVTLGNIQMLLDWDWTNAEKTFQRTIANAPNAVGARIYYGVLLTHLRRYDEAQAQLEQAIKLDPTYAGAISNLGMVYYCRKDFAQAEQLFRKALEFDEKWSFAHMMLWNCLWMQGKKTESLKYIVSSFDAAGGKALARKVEEKARTSEPDEIIRFIMRELNANPRKPNSYSLAVWAMAIGDKETALGALEKAFQEHLPWTIAIAATPNFEPLHGEARFQEILRKMNLD